jgi:hypothetical protein
MLTMNDVSKIEAGTLTLADVSRLEEAAETRDVGYHLRVQMFAMNPKLRHPIVQAAIDAARAA